MRRNRPSRPKRPFARMLALCLPATVLAAAAASGAAAQTADPSQRIDIRSAQATGTAPRRDVSSVCPQIRDELPEALASAWQQVGQPGTVRVLFTLDGQRIVDVTPVSGPRRYFRWVRTALNDMGCRADHAQAQTFQLDIRFVDLYDTPQRSAVAVLMP